MKNLLLILCTVLLNYSFAQEYELDTKDASVKFQYVSEDTKGTISGITAKITLNLQDSLSTASIEATADVNSLSTGNKTRDKHLKSKDFFDAEKYPSMTFTCSEIVMEGEDYYAKGTMQIKDVKKEVKFLVKPSADALKFYLTFYSADFGISVKEDRKASKVKVQVTVPLS